MTYEWCIANSCELRVTISCTALLRISTALLCAASLFAPQVRIFHDLALTYLSLIALPFVLFACPFVGELLHQMRFTAYDQVGGSVSK